MPEISEGFERLRKNLLKTVIGTAVFLLVSVGADARVIQHRDGPVKAGEELAAAMDIPPRDLVSATTSRSPEFAKGVATGKLGKFFPTKGDSFAILTTGNVYNAPTPNNEGDLSGRMEGLDNSQENDMVQLTLVLSPPPGAQGLAFDFAFYSEAFSELVGSTNPFNDTFTAELSGSSQTIAGNQVISPLNFALDGAGKPVSVNTFALSGSTLTTYDGGTTLLRATTPIHPAFSTIEIVLTIQDLGDSRYDSAVFLDNFTWCTSLPCPAAGARAVPGAETDKDRDALPDAWEENGLDINGDGVIDLDLPRMGASKDQKDLFIEIDFMAGEDDDCVFGFCSKKGHSHKPKKPALELVIKAFLDQGISLHIDAGRDSVMNPVTGEKWGHLSESDRLGHRPQLGSVVGGEYNWTEFQEIKDRRFSAARAQVFHYVIFAHKIGETTALGDLLGVSRGIPGSDFIVSLGPLRKPAGTKLDQATTLMHELGHNLSLRHGGGDHFNNKPNYLSVMNNLFSARGLIRNRKEGVIDYSFLALPPLNEASLDESVGLQGGSAIAAYGTRYFCPEQQKAKRVRVANDPIDWDCDGTAGETSVIADLANEAGKPPGLHLLASYNDWANLQFDGGLIGPTGSAIELPLQTLQSELTVDAGERIPAEHAVEVTSLWRVAQLAGTTRVYEFEVRNAGEEPDVYTLAAVSQLGWADASSLPASLALGPEQSATVSIPVSIPAGVAANLEDELTLTATSQGNSLIDDSSEMLTYVPEHPPVANAGADQRVECSSQHGTPVALDGSGSQAPSGGELVYQWQGPFPEGGGAVSGARPTVTLPLGVSTLTLRVNDGIVDSYPDEVVVTVVDTTPPAITSTLSPPSLWPPSHDLREIRATVVAADICTPPVVALAAVVSSEPDDAQGNGDGNTKNDIQGAAIGTADFRFSLRAERAGSGPGRTYTVRYTATDSSGNQSRDEDPVTVPHSQKK